MKIVYLNPVGVIGGAERVLLHTMAAVREVIPDAELHLIAFTDGPLLRRAEERGVRTHLLSMPDALVGMGDSSMTANGRLRGVWTVVRQGVPALPAAWRWLRVLRRTLAQIAPDLIHSNGIKTHALTRMLGSRAPVIWHVHDFLGRRALMASVLKWASKGAVVALAVSQAVARDAQAVLVGLPVEVLYNAIDTESFSPRPVAGQVLDELAGLPLAEPGTIRVGLVATFGRAKGQDVFLEAAARASRNQRALKLRFYIVGGPIYRTPGSQFTEGELKALASRLQLTHDVGFIGFQDNPVDIYRALDIVVHASTLPEPFGMTIVEAMACGKPVIVSRAGGAAELFTHDLDALGIPPADAAALASAMEQLAADPEQRRRLGDHARRTAVQRFSCQRLGPQILALYQRFLNLPALPL